MKIDTAYMKTNDIAKFIGYSGDYLLKNREILFFEGIHYFPKEKRIDWKVDKMIQWMEDKDLSPQAQEILDMVC